MRKFKILNMLLVVLAIFIFPTIVNAQRFYPEGTDLNVWIDDTKWYVFTRDNLYNNPELDEIGITYDYLYDFMHNNYVYLDGALFYDDSTDNLELLIRKKSIDKIKNLTNYSNDEIMELAEELAEKQDSDVYDIYESDYKYVYLKYTDLGYYLVEYYTIVNGESYTLTVQKQSPFTSNELYEIETIVDSIDFDVDTSLKEPSGGLNSSSSSIWEEAITGGIAAAIISGISALVNHKKKKKDDEEIQTDEIKDNSKKIAKTNDSKFKNIMKKIGIIILSFISSEMLLLIILGDLVDGTRALLLVMIVTIPFYFLYNNLFKKKQ